MKILSKFLTVILFLISPLISDTIIFNDGQMLIGELIKITKEHPYDPKTGAEQEVLFKVEKYNLNRVPKNFVINKSDDNVFMFDVNSIYKIEDEYGMLIFSSNKKLASSTGIRKVNPETGNTLEIVPTNLIIKKNEKINEIYQGSEISLYFYNPVFGSRAIPTRILEEVKYQGIGVDYGSQKYFVKTNAGAFEIANIRKVEYITDRENRAIEGFLIYGGISLVAGGILWLIAGPDANTADGSAAPALAGFLLIAGSPIAGIYGAMANWSVPAKKGFDIYKGAWEFDIDSMAPNSKSVEQN